MIVNLNLVAVVDRHPLFTRLNRYANEDAGVVVRVAHLEDHTNTAVANFAAGPVEKPHAAARFDEAVFDGIATRADMFPAGEVFAVEERLPFRFLRSRRDGEGGCCYSEAGNQKQFVHG